MSRDLENENLVLPQHHTSHPHPSSPIKPSPTPKRLRTSRFLTWITGFIILTLVVLYTVNKITSSPRFFLSHSSSTYKNGEVDRTEDLLHDPKYSDSNNNLQKPLLPKVDRVAPVRPTIMFHMDEIESATSYPVKDLDKPAVPYVLESYSNTSRPWWTEEEEDFPTIRSYLSTIHEMTSHRPPRCFMTPWHLERYAPIINSTSTIYLALNLLNNENIFPTLITSLTTLLPLIGPHRVFVSVVESGSNDKTPQMLVLLAKLLDTLNVRHYIKSEGRTHIPNKSGGHRITVLAAVRNQVMDPLYTGRVGEFDNVLFMNDIVHCPTDVLEVLYQHWKQRAHMTCSVDWENYRVYDRWVARSMSGRPYYHEQEINDWWGRGQTDPLPEMLPEPEDAEDKKRMAAFLPTQVFSCWNGMAMIDSRAFYPPNMVRFREAYNDPGHTDKVSECLLLPVDMWKVQMSRFQLAPRAAVAYDNRWYDQYRSDIRAPFEPELKTLEAQEQVHWNPTHPDQIVFQDGTVSSPERWAPWDEA